MTEQPQPPDAFPDVADDDSPERGTYPEPREPGLPTDDGYLGADHTGTTPAEERQGETLDERVAAEVPDEGADPLARAGATTEEGVLREGETADERAGRLVEPDQGGGADAEKDVVASSELGTPDLTAEEDAVRVHDAP